MCNQDGLTNDLGRRQRIARGQSNRITGMSPTHGQ